MSMVLDRSTLDKVQALARQARLASTAHKPLEVPSDMVDVLADYLKDSLEAAEDQAWYWSDGWQAAEREAEAEIARGAVKTFDTMEALLNDLGWPQ
jgi:hypothetical protein